MGIMKKIPTEGGTRKEANRSFVKSGQPFYHRAVHSFKKAQADARFKDLIRRARDIWFKKTKKQIDGGRRRMCCEEDEEEQEVTQAPMMEWDMGDEMDNIRNYAV